jgi:hypothetical protein
MWNPWNPYGMWGHSKVLQTFSLRHTTNIILVDSNLNIIRGDLRHMDHWSTYTVRGPGRARSSPFSLALTLALRGQLDPRPVGSGQG